MLHLFTQPHFREMRSQQRDTSTSSFRGCPAADYIRAWEQKEGIAEDRRFDHPDSSDYQIGFDFVQIFNSIQHSTGVVMLRFDAPLIAKALNVLVIRPNDYIFSEVLLIDAKSKKETSLHFQAVICGS